MNIRKNKWIMIDPYMTKPEIIETYFAPVPSAPRPDTYKARQDVTVICCGPQAGHLALIAAAPGLNRARDAAKQLTVNALSQKITPEDKVMMTLLEKRKRLLWVSRHNMDTRAHRTIIDKFGALTLIIPLDVRVVSSDEIMRAVEQHACDIVVAVLPDEIIDDVRDKLVNSDVTFLKYVSSAVKTGASFSPAHSIQIRERVEYHFKCFNDIRSGEVIPAVDDDREVVM